jgi:hypothetical protein
MITSITPYDGRFKITVSPDLTQPFRGISWGTRFEYGGQRYMVQGSDPYVTKDRELVYLVDAVPMQGR